jgi:uncharacterized membrane protein YobD (UPF0266 family)
MPLPSLAQNLQRRNNGDSNLIGGIMGVLIFNTLFMNVELKENTYI